MKIYKPLATIFFSACIISATLASNSYLPPKTITCTGRGICTAKDEAGNSYKYLSYFYFDPAVFLPGTYTFAGTESGMDDNFNQIIGQYRPAPYAYKTSPTSIQSFGLFSAYGTLITPDTKAANNRWKLADPAQNNTYTCALDSTSPSPSICPFKNVPFNSTTHSGLKTTASKSKQLKASDNINVSVYNETKNNVNTPFKLEITTSLPQTPTHFISTIVDPTPADAVKKKTKGLRGEGVVLTATPSLFTVGTTNYSNSYFFSFLLKPVGVNIKTPPAFIYYLSRMPGQAQTEALIEPCFITVKGQTLYLNAKFSDSFNDAEVDISTQNQYPASCLKPSKNGKSKSIISIARKKG